MLIMAVRPNDELGLATILPKHWTFSNFTTLWSGSGLGGSIGTSLQIAASATVIVLLVALPAAYCTARRRFRGRTAFLLLVLTTQMFQPAAMLVGVQREFTNFGVPPTLSLIIINAGFNLAFAVWILNAFFSSIPVELEEASMVDGLGRVGALLRITLPLAAPGIVTALIFTFISAWNEFLVALTLSLGQPPSQQPLTVAINNYIGEYSIDWGHLFAAGLVATVPVIILFAFIERRVVGGLTAGAVK
jgi:multiple sugar transport system permease protein